MLIFLIVQPLYSVDNYSLVPAISEVSSRIQTFCVYKLSWNILQTILFFFFNKKPSSLTLSQCILGSSMFEKANAFPAPSISCKLIRGSIKTTVHHYSF